MQVLDLRNTHSLTFFGRDSEFILKSRSMNLAWYSFYNHQANSVTVSLDSCGLVAGQMFLVLSPGESADLYFDGVNLT